MNSAPITNFRLRMLALATLLALAASSAHAANCDMQLSNSTIDYGRLNQGALVESSAPPNDVLLGKRRLTLNVVCAEPARLALRFNGAPAPGKGYLFARNGNFTVLMSEATVDGNAVALAKTDASGNPVQAGAAAQYLDPNAGVAAVSGTTAVLGKHLVVSLEIESSLPRSATKLRDATQLEGSGQLELLR